MLRRVVPTLVLLLVEASWCLLATVAWPGSVRAQSLEAVPLTDLTSFRGGGAGWLIAGEAWSLWDSADLQLEDGTGVVASHAKAPSDLITTWEHGDLVLELEYLVSKGSTSGIFLQGRYEVQLADSWGVEEPTFRDAAGISEVDGGAAGSGVEGSGGPAAASIGRLSAGHPPRINASKAPGLWQHLRIVFEAPRFDENGGKTAPARIVDVVHNGVTVQESVQIPGPTRDAPFQDERAAGPLVLAHEGEDVAFRNIRFRHFEPVEPVMLSDVRYTLRRGEFSSLNQMGAAPVSAEGRTFGYVWDLFGRTADRVGMTWDGTIHIPRTGEYTFTMRFNWIDEIPYDEDAVAGKGRFSIGSELVVDHTGADSAAAGTVHLQEGAHPFSFSYFKNRRLWRPIVFFRVDAPGMPGQYLNAYRTLPEPETSYPPVPVEPLREPYVLRSFGDYDSLRMTNVINVGDPSRIHYALDADVGSLFAVWKGPFVDVSSMWTARGELQNAVPAGQRIALTHRPSLAILSDPGAPWPVKGGEDLLEFDGYSLDDSGHPTFRYSGSGLHVREELRQEDDGRSLRRTLQLTGEAQRVDVWVLLAEGRDISERAPGIYSVDGGYFIDVAGDEQVRVRQGDERHELIAPVRFTKDGAALSYSILW